MTDVNPTLTVGMILNPRDAHWAVMALKSVEGIADDFVIVEDGSNAEQLKALDDYVDGRANYHVIHQPYLGTNGLQYQVMLEHCGGDWVLLLDADEVLADNGYLLSSVESPHAKTLLGAMVFLFFLVVPADRVD